MIGTVARRPLLTDRPVDQALLDRCAQVLRIPQPGGEESLNVAAAAAVCLYEWMRQRGA